MPESPIAMVVLDWAGTAVDHGSLAPVRTLQKVFAMHGCDVEDEVIRRDMGLAKRDHIRKLLREPEVAELWQSASRPVMTETDVDTLYAEFIPLQTACLLEYAEVIDGVIPVVDALRSRGARIGGTTGYTRPMLDALEAAARSQGYAPDASVCPEDVSAGRPHPFMCYQLAVTLKAAPLWTCVKIGDTISDIEEGCNAGMWTIALTRTGNMVGLSLQDWQALPDSEQSAALATARASLASHHAHFIVPGVADIQPAIAEIEARIIRGERP